MTTLEDIKDPEGVWRVHVEGVVAGEDRAEVPYELGVTEEPARYVATAGSGGLGGHRFDHEGMMVLTASRMPSTSLALKQGSSEHVSL